jgi:HAD superfamily hydrolase (TIGR01490 family)
MVEASPSRQMSELAKIAFYDLDGTLVSSNIVVRYAFFVRHLPSRVRALWKTLKLVTTVPTYIALDHFSRQLFNEVFFREYRGMSRDWLLALSSQLFEQVVRPSLYPGAQELIERDRAEGYRLALITGELDIALGPVLSYFGFDTLISNRLVFENGLATGDVVRPLIAGEAKANAMVRLSRDLGIPITGCRGYSDSFSDVPMLEAVGEPAAVNPDRRLRKTAAERSWPILNLRRNGHPKARDEENHVYLP